MANKTVTVTIDGVPHELDYNAETGLYEKQIQAPNRSSYNENDNHKFNVVLTAVNEAGTSKTIDSSDPTWGEVLALRVFERVKPTVEIVSPTNGDYLNTATPTVIFKVKDNDSGVDLSTLRVVVNGGVINPNDYNITEEVIDGGYKVTVVPKTAWEDRLHTVSVTVGDNDENTSDEVSTSFTTDTVAPELNVLSPKDGLITNNSEVVVSGNTVDSNTVEISITLNGEDTGEVSLIDGSFEKTITLSEGNNVIVVTATDRAGKVTTKTINVTLDTSEVKFTEVRLIENPTDAGQMLTLTVRVE